MKLLQIFFTGVLLVVFLIASINSIFALPPPPPPTPSMPGGPGEDVSAESTGDAVEEDFILEETAQESSESSGTATSLESRFAVLEHRVGILEKQGIPVWAWFLIAVNGMILGVVIYLLVRRKVPLEYTS
ncbi:hypothetical protein HYX13_00930 [Candidatus Woesearchaeota archaeon]|nr:hypothetical protein [Candidatus Woesearchaeota archaeon]